MGMESQESIASVPSLSTAQVHAFLRAEPKILGAIQIIIASLILCLSVTLLQQQIHFLGDIKVLCVVAGQLVLSGSVLVHSGRKPSVFWLKAVLVLHLVSAAFATAALGLLSKNLPYQQDAYHCEHCRRLENATVLLLDGVVGTLVLFLLLEVLICITILLYGLNSLSNGSLQLASGSMPGRVQPRRAPAVARVAVPAAAAIPVEPEESQSQEMVSTPQQQSTDDPLTDTDVPQVVASMATQS